MNSKVYLGLALTSVLFILSLQSYFALKATPFTGSQTRTSGYLEVDYGPNTTQSHYAEAGFQFVTKIEEFTEPADLIIIGDSFSNDARKSWVNKVSDDLGIRALVFHIDDIGPEKVLNHPVYLRHPPKLLFLQSAEAGALTRFRKLKFIELDESGSARTNNFEWPEKRLNLPTFRYERPSEASIEKRFTVASQYINKSIERALIGDRLMIAKPLNIDCEMCFSNQLAGQFLVEKSSLAERAYRMHFREEAISGLKRIKNWVEGNGHTTFTSVIFPNKITVYGEYTEMSNNPSVFRPPIPMQALNMVDLLSVFKAAVGKGETDVYLPNDHHTSARGYEIAAEAILHHLRSQGSIPAI